jgi:hypothetical protein
MRCLLGRFLFIALALALEVHPLSPTGQLFVEVLVELLQLSASLLHPHHLLLCLRQLGEVLLVLLLQSAQHVELALACAIEHAL